MQQRIMALDVGDKRIGVAVSDETNIISTAVDVIERRTLKQDIERIKDFTKEYKIGKIIVGLPLTMKGTKSIQTEKVNKFIDILGEMINIPVLSFDERLSTAQGERLLIKADISRRKRKKLIDKIAAQIILQTYLDWMGQTLGSDTGND
ncbi:MAG: Holliday junction resolvase RuvX [Candidatus Omnitrophota bacterium]|nr:MAG: Holliday junction resolvase RuvX [Candidatus Omnitrophota bacterium]